MMIHLTLAWLKMLKYITWVPKYGPLAKAVVLSMVHEKTWSFIKVSRP